MRLAVHTTVLAMLPAVLCRAATPPSVEDQVLGEWQMIYDTKDANGNNRLDDAERKPPSADRKGDATGYIQLRAGGMFVFDKNLKLKGAYTIRKNSEQQAPYRELVLDPQDKEIGQYRFLIISVSDKELVLSPSNKTFWVYVRP
jgi:hypothetical protein